MLSISLTLYRDEVLRVIMCVADQYHVQEDHTAFQYNLLHLAASYVFRICTYLLLNSLRVVKIVWNTKPPDPNLPPCRIYIQLGLSASTDDPKVSMCIS
jgi:hypothetical protein